jgi:uncharacterized protein YlxP (DUF503 family)
MDQHAAVAPVGQSGRVLHACALAVDFRIPASHSLKDRRAVVRRLVDGSRSRFGVAAAEVDHQDQWQRCELGFAAVSGTPGQVTDVLDSVERFIWSDLEIEVVSMERTWLETGG